MGKIRLLLVFIIIPLLGFGCRGGGGKAKQQLEEKIALTIWGVQDSQDDFAGVIAQWLSQHPNIAVSYRKFRLEEYESQLIEALAEDRGPDIISFHNTWGKKYQSKLLAMPLRLTLPVLVEEGIIKKEVKAKLQSFPTLSVSEIRQKFPETVLNDAVLQDQIYGLPLSVDSLALYYNKTMMDRAGIPIPPKNWEDFVSAVKKLTIQDTRGGIIQSGTALGTAKNVERASDILIALMIQNGAQVFNDAGSGAVFDKTSPNEREYSPGLAAVEFFSDFANPAKEVYSWHDKLPNSVESFALERVAMIFGYGYHYPIIKARNPRLNFAVTTMPQISGTSRPVTLANYWLFGVSKKTKRPNEAWSFVQFMANEKNAPLYLNKTGKPAALRSLINQDLGNPERSVFASQTLIAQRWFPGFDVKKAEDALLDLITKFLANEGSLQDLARVATGKLNQSLIPPSF